MDWFGGLFLLALAAALITGKAYFREVYSRKDEPAKYWRVVVCYGALASYGILMLLIGSLFSDAATRVADDIESGAAAFGRSDAGSYTITHKLRAWPDGCGSNYTLQLSKASALLVWCKDATSGRVTSSHTTTYHLRFVDVPETFIVDKKAGEPSYIDLQKHDGRIIVVNVR